MRVLVISRTPWRNDNSFGNTYNNFFSSMKEVEIANIYLADGMPQPEPFVTAYYQISEKAMANTVFKFCRGNGVGQCVKKSELRNVSEGKKVPVKKGWFDKAFNFAKNTQLSGFFMIREFIWRMGKINEEELFRFIEEFKPDAMFVPAYYASYVSNLTIKIKQRINIPLIVESAIDVYTMRQFSCDPFFWINRLTVRKTIRKIYRLADARFLISDKQRDEYSKIFGLEFKTLYKTPIVERCLYPYRTTNSPVRFLFTGNLSSGRWKVVAEVAKALSLTGGGKLDIYSATPISAKMRKRLSIEGVSELHLPVSGEEVLRLQNGADVLLHVESFDLKNRLSVRYAISTKIMDYISDCRCILAIGPSDVASMEFLKSENAALIVNKKNEITGCIRELLATNDKIFDYANRAAFACKRLSQKTSAGELILTEIKRVVAMYSKRERGEV